MRRAIGFLVLVLAVGCGGQPEESEVSGVDAGPVEVDAGSADAGSGPCDATALVACGTALQVLVGCCATVDQYRAPPVMTFCEHVAGGDADVSVACKDISSMSCTQIEFEGFCF